jgi:hypothetical protein
MKHRARAAPPTIVSYYGAAAATAGFVESPARAPERSRAFLT